MNRRTRLRRTGILCLQAIRNAAYFRAWNAAPISRRRQQFWIPLNGNFVDMAILDWCKLFGDVRAIHHWSKSITDSHAFLEGLHHSIHMDAAEFELYRLELRAYRDKYVAHLDELNFFTVPDLQPAIHSTRHLYQYMVDFEDDVGAFIEAPRSAFVFYQEHLRLGRAAHSESRAP